VAERRAREVLVLTLAASAGAHAALAPAHAAEGAAVAAMFALSAVVLAAAAIVVDRHRLPAADSVAALLLAGLLTAYFASRLTTLWPLAHPEPVDSLGALTKLVEAAGLLLALRLLQKPRAAQELPARHEGVAR
jgi:hypothetical protein